MPKKIGADAGSAETRLRLKHPRFFIRIGPNLFGGV